MLPGCSRCNHSDGFTKVTHTRQSKNMQGNLKFGHQNWTEAQKEESCPDTTHPAKKNSSSSPKPPKALKPKGPEP